MNNITVWAAIVLILSPLVWYVLRLRTKDVRYFQYEAGVTFIVRRSHVAFMKWRYRLYAAYTFSSTIDEAATQQRFYSFGDASHWIRSRSRGARLHVFRGLGNFRLGIARDGQIITIPSDKWRGEVILARNVKRGADLEQTVQGLFKYWLGKNAVKDGKLASHASLFAMPF